MDAIFVKLQTTPDLLNKTLRTTNGQVDNLAASFKGVADNLNLTIGELKPAITNFRVLSDSLKKLELSKTIAQTQQTLHKVNAALDKFGQGDNTLGKLMTEDSLYVNLNTLVLRLDTLAKHFDNNPNHFLAPLGKSQKKIERDRKKAQKAADQKK